MAGSRDDASALFESLTSCVQVCQTTSQLVNRLKAVSRHIAAFSSDLQAFDDTLATLKDYLDEDETTSDLLRPSVGPDIHTVVDNSNAILQDYCVAAQVYLQDEGLRLGTGDQREEEKVTQLSDELGICRMTLDVAIAAAKLLKATRVDAAELRIEHDRQHLELILTALSVRLDQHTSRSAEASDAVVKLEDAPSRIARDAASLLSSLSPQTQSSAVVSLHKASPITLNMSPSIGLSLNRVVSTLANASNPKTASAVPSNRLANDKAEQQAQVAPELEYTGTSYLLSLYFHGTPEHVEHIKHLFRQKTQEMFHMSLSTLCREVLNEMTQRESPGARLEFSFYDQVYDIHKIRQFLTDSMDFRLPPGFAIGDTALLPPMWTYTLHPVDRTGAMNFTKGDRWTLVFIRASRISDAPAKLFGDHGAYLIKQSRTIEVSDANSVARLPSGKVLGEDRAHQMHDLGLASISEEDARV